jgi:hypothetical protein
MQPPGECYVENGEARRPLFFVRHGRTILRSTATACSSSLDRALKAVVAKVSWWLDLRGMNPGRRRALPKVRQMTLQQNPNIARRREKSRCYVDALTTGKGLRL